MSREAFVKLAHGHYDPLPGAGLKGDARHPMLPLLGRRRVEQDRPGAMRDQGASRTRKPGSPARPPGARGWRLVYTAAGVRQDAPSDYPARVQSNARHPLVSIAREREKERSNLGA